MNIRNGAELPEEPTMVNFAKTLVSKAWKLVLGFFGVLRRAMCCFRMRRRASDVGLPVYLTTRDEKMCAIQNSGDDFQSWDAWNEDDVPVVVGVDSAGNVVDLNQTATASAQRHSLSASGGMGAPNGGRSPPPGGRGSGDQRRESQSDDDVDFFKDMAPTNIRQKKYVPRPEDSLGQAVPTGLSSRLKVDTRAILPYHGADLGVLDDDAALGVEASWEEQAELEVDSAIREKRQAERERRIAEHQRRKMEKEMQRGGAGGHGAAFINSLPPQQQPLPANARRKVY